jgi:hypothetical protein
MISLYFNSQDRFSRYGINHFIEKFGIPIEINKPSPSGIVITYGIEVHGDFVISVEENEVKNNICGKILGLDENIPLCENPFNTGAGKEVVVDFESGETRYPCVTRTDEGYTIGIDIFKETGYLLSGHLDSLRPSLDSNIKKALASKPTVDILQNILFNAILAGCNERNIPLVQKSCWPDGKRFAVCLTHDVDELFKSYQWISRPMHFLVKANFSGLKNQVISFFQKVRGKDPYYTYKDIMKIENDLGVKSTYFILKETGKCSFWEKKTWYLYGRNRNLQSPEIHALIQQLISNGDEVAIHGSFFSYKNPILLNAETQELEQIINEEVIGTRQHNLNLIIPETWDYQEKAGLKYDSTLGFHDTIGFRWGTSSPFSPNTGDVPQHLLELPLVIMDKNLVSSELTIPDWIQITNEVERYQGVLTLLWHPPMFNDLEYPGLRGIYMDIIQYCQKRQAWVAPARDIYNWVSLRNEQMFSSSFSGSLCSITPVATDTDQFFTLYLPPGTNGIIPSGNAEIIRKEGDCIYIKTNRLQENEKIIIGIT